MTNIISIGSKYKHDVIQKIDAWMTRIYNHIKIKFLIIQRTSLQLMRFSFHVYNVIVNLFSIPIIRKSYYRFSFIHKHLGNYFVGMIPMIVTYKENIALIRNLIHPFL